MSFYSRYKAGEHVHVWSELIWHDVQEHQNYDDVWSVAQLTMERVKQNIDTLIPRLQDLGYRFGYDWLDPEEDYDELIAVRPLRGTPQADILQRFVAIEENRKRKGFIPLSVRAWYTIVGSVNFVGTPPESWLPYLASASYTETYTILDPLQIDLLLDYSVREAHEREKIELGADEHTKYFFSGGGPYAVNLDFYQSGDGLLLSWLDTSFVTFLRVALSWAGFPGIGRLPLRPTRDIELLVQNLIPF